MDDILWKYSWVNILMLMYSIPGYEKEKEKGDKEYNEINDISELGDLLS
jgi:hypothetical protein